MSERLKKLRATVADLKAAPIYIKAAKAEQVMDALIALLEQQHQSIAWLKIQIQINQLEDESNGKG